MNQDPTKAEPLQGNITTGSKYTDDLIEDIFSYHSPKDGQPGQYEAIRVAAREFAKVIIANTPPCADQTVVIRKLRECVMTANASIALEGKS